MCYDVSYTLSRELKMAERRGDTPQEIALIQEKIRKWRENKQPKYHASGFSHPELLVFTNEQPYEPQGYIWGLIPAWVKDWDTAKTFYNQTLNARGETIFEKPAFRNAAKNKRCLIYVDGFFEHHHLGKSTYPFYITMKNESPIVLAGLWEEWTDKETGEIKRTTTIVTTDANEVMAKIHNNPKADGARMPVILPKEKQESWLSPCRSELDKKFIQSLIEPYPDEELSYHSVRRLRGKEAIGNVPEANQPFEYHELAMLF